MANFQEDKTLQCSNFSDLLGTLGPRFSVLLCNSYFPGQTRLTADHIIQKVSDGVRSTAKRPLAYLV